MLAAGCLERPADSGADEASRNGSLEQELEQARAEASRLRAENAIMGAQLLSMTPWARTIELAPVGGTGGNPFVRACPAGQAVVSLHGRAGAMVDALAAECAPLDGPVVPPGVEAGPVRTDLEPVGGQGGGAYELDCPVGTWAVGMEGHAADTLAGLRLVCRARGMLGAASVDLGADEGTGAEGSGAGVASPHSARRDRVNQTTPPVGTNDGDPFTRICPPGWVMVGLSGHSGRLIDRLALHCGEWPPPAPAAGH